MTLAFEDYLRELEAQQEQQPEGRPAAEASLSSRLCQVRLLDADNQKTNVFDMGDTARLEIIAETPDGIAPVIAAGLVRNDKTAIYGVFSDIDQVEPRRLDAHTFRVVYELYDLSLLPGSYTLRAHVLDPPALRMFDTVEKDFSVRGESRELGICRLPHRWTFD